jgi:hypothetical protein
MGAIVEAPTAPGDGLPFPPAPLQTVRQTPAPLPGFSANADGLEEVVEAKKHFDSAQWLLLGQFILVFWLLVGLMLSVIFSAERCKLFANCSDSYGRWQEPQGRTNEQATSCTNRMDDRMRLSRCFYTLAGTVVVFAAVIKALSLIHGFTSSQPLWFTKLEKAEVSLVKQLPFPIPGLTPTAAPTVAPEVNAKVKAQAAASAAMSEYQAVKNQLEQLKAQMAQQDSAAQAQLKQQKEATQEAQEKLRKEKAKNQEPVTLAPTPAPTAAPTFAPKQMSNLAEKVAALKKKAEAKAAQAEAVTPAPTPPPPPPPLPGAAPAAPCATVAPATPTGAPLPSNLPKIQNFIPPAPCTCKLSDTTTGGRWHYDDHCNEYAGIWATTPVCVVSDPACSAEVQDAAQGNGDKLIKCIAAPEGGGTPYSITLDPTLSASSDLGMKILPDQTMKNLIVTKITGGIVEQYNSAHAGAPIKVGDMITAVNGQSGDSVNLLKECLKKQQLDLSMLHQVGYPIPLPGGAAAAAPAPPPALAGQCPADVHPWAERSVCLSNQPQTGFAPGTFQWHCPWESMMLVSTKKFGGCNGMKYDCAGMNVNAVLDLYSTHDTMATPPPEGSLDTVEYVSCCIKHQCQGQPLSNCGEAPWTPGVSVSPFVGKANPCGAAGCERRFSVSKVLNVVPKESRPVFVVAGVSLLLVAGVVMAIRRRRGQRADHHFLLDAEACTNEVE